jgi:hypothetical protein
MAYIGNSPGVASQRIVTTFTATASQTTFTPSSGYTVGYLDVYHNGVKLINGDDYTASNGTTFVLASGAASGDVIEAVAYLPRGLSDGYTKAEADARYMDINAVTLPTQTGNSGKYLTTDGSAASWGTVDLSTKVSKTGDTMTGALSISKDAAAVQTLNRTTSDGDIQVFKKDNTTVGSIGSYAGLYTNIGTSNVGLMFNTGSGSVIPHNMSTNTPADNSLDLGQAAYRWKDLYLSGGVYLGGTGAANYLDDYEEGNWTPVATNVTLTAAAGKYVKIGQFCFLWGKIQFPTNTDTNPNSIVGLPFTNIWGASFADTMYSGAMAITNFGSADILPMLENQNVQFRDYNNNSYLNVNLSTHFLYFTAAIRVA